MESTLEEVATILEDKIQSVKENEVKDNQEAGDFINYYNKT